MEVDAYLERANAFVTRVKSDVAQQMDLLAPIDPTQVISSALLARAFHFFEAAHNLYPDYAEPSAGLCRVVIETTQNIIYHIMATHSGISFDSHERREKWERIRQNYAPSLIDNLRNHEVRKALYGDSIVSEVYGDLSAPLHGSGYFGIYIRDNALLINRAQDPRVHVIAMTRLIFSAITIAGTSNMVVTASKINSQLNLDALSKEGLELFRIGNRVMEDLWGEPLPTYGELRKNR